MMDKLEFQVGKKYKFADGREMHNECEFTGVNGVFECSHVDGNGDCWTSDALFRGKSRSKPGWCAATINRLQSGEVIEVTE